MTQIIMEIPDSYTQELENMARSQQKTIQDIVSDMIRAFIESEKSNEDGFDVTKDPVYQMGDSDSDEESAENFSQNVDNHLYHKGDYPLKTYCITRKKTITP